jgi:hypothetical protein
MFCPLGTHSGWSGHDYVNVRFSAREKPQCCPLGYELWPGKARAQLEAVHLRTRTGAAERGRGMVTLRSPDPWPRPSPADGLCEPAHDSRHDPLIGWVAAPLDQLGADRAATLQSQPMQ